jgi:hypothetical protein
MSEVVEKLGVRDPNCAGLGAVRFLTELAVGKKPGKDNYAQIICDHCVERRECKIALGEVGVSGITSGDTIA